MAELKEMFNTLVEVLTNLMDVLKKFIADMTSTTPMPWEDETWNTVE